MKKKKQQQQQQQQKTEKQKLTMCTSRKYPYPPYGWLLDIPRGRGVSKTKTVEGKYEAKLEFSEGWGKLVCHAFK